MPWWKLANWASVVGRPSSASVGGFGRDGAEHDVDAALLAVGVAAEAADLGQRVGEVHLALALERLPLLVVEELARQALGRRGVERWRREIAQRSVHPQTGRRAGVDVNVAGAALDRELEHLLRAAHARGGRLVRGRGRGGSRRLGGACLLRLVLTLGVEQGVELGLRQPAALEQQLPKPARAAFARLLRGHLLQLLARDELVVQGEPAKQRRVGGHRCAQANARRDGRQRR